jgi:tripartite-type tricarboxylate transporter receptor subunit TctC
MNRREFLAAGAACAASPLLPARALADTYPARPVRLVVGYAPGGSTDITARIIGPWLAERLGQSFVIENRPGAGTNIATESVVKAAPDGYTLLMVTVASTINATLYDNLSFVFLRDITPVAGVERQTNIVLAHPSLLVKNIPELIAHAKDNPGKITMASAGVGSFGHLAGELLQMMAGIKLVHVPYRGAGPAMTDLLGGQVQTSVIGLAGALPHVRSGKLRALAVTAATRSAVLPDVPAVGESVPGYEASDWFGVGAPKGTPPAIVDRLSQTIAAGLATPEIIKHFADLGGTPLVMAPAAFGKLLAEETEKWGKVVRAANIKPG